MEPGEKQILERVLALSEENNQMLHRIRRSQKIAGWVRFIYWAIIIGASIGAFYFVQPYIDQLKDIYGQAQGSLFQ